MAYYYDICWHIDTWIAVSDAGNISTSTDAINWNTYNIGTSESLLCIASNGSNMVLAGGASFVYKSVDKGVTWTKIGTSYGVTDITWSPTLSKFFATTNSSNLVVNSSDGITWTNNPAYMSYNVTAIQWCFDKLIAVGMYNSIYRSTDGITWSLLYSESANPTRCGFAIGATSAYNISVAGHYTNLTTTANGGTTWVNQTGGTSAEVFGYCFTGSYLITCSSLQIWGNGLIWDTQNNPVMRAAAWNGSYGVAVGANGVIVKINSTCNGYTKMLPDAAPIASSVNVAGSLYIGAVITGNYVYSDAEGDAESGSTFQWYRGDTTSGPWTAISGATAKTYTLTSNDNSKFIKFEVIPHSL